MTTYTVTSLFCCTFVLVLGLLPHSSTAFVATTSTHQPHRFLWTLSPRSLSLSSQSTSLASSCRPIIDWAKQQTLVELVPKEDAYKIINELLANDDLMDSSKSNFDKNWDSLDQRLRSEDQTLEQLLGPASTKRLMDSVTDVKYDKEVVSTFLNSNAVNRLFAMVLYDGISEFTQRIDVFGNIVNTLPIIGPIRQQITKQFRDQLDRSLGPLIKNFLAQYTKVAIRESIDFVLSSENQQLFASANQNLVQNVLQRPVNSLVPSKDVADELKKQVFTYFRNDIDPKDVERYLDVVYDILDDQRIENVVDVDRVLSASPTLERTLDSIWDKMKAAEVAASTKDDDE